MKEPTLKNNIIAIYKEIDEKLEFLRFSAAELGFAESTLSKYLREHSKAHVVHEKQEELHTLVVNWKKKELVRANEILLENS